MQSVTFVVSTLTCIANGFYDFYTPRVYDGVEVFETEFLYTVSLQMNYYPYTRICTGNLLSDTWVLTAGHCIYESISTVIRYREFTVNATKARSYVRVLKSFKHPGFQGHGRFLRNDVALMLIDRVPIMVYAQLFAVDYKSLLGLPVKFAGFGKTNKTPKDLVPEDEVRPLQKGEGVIITCPRLGPLYGPAVCVAPKCSKKLQGTRVGDSGGPLEFDGKLVGVLSAPNADTPISYYAPLSPYLDWISDVMDGTYFHQIGK